MNGPLWKGSRIMFFFVAVLSADVAYVSWSVTGFFFVGVKDNANILKRGMVIWALL